MYPDSFIGPIRLARSSGLASCALVLSLCACVGRVAGRPSDTAPSQSVTLTIASARVTPWRNGAQGAYSLIHDDFCLGADGILSHAVPELRSRNLRAGLATVAGHCAAAGLVARLQELEADGFEVVSHSMTHPHISADLAEHENVESKRLLESYVRQPVTFFAFPFDDRNDATIALVAAAGYIGARAGSNGVNPADFADPFRVRFDVFGRYSSYGTDPVKSLDRYVDDAVSAGGWALRECHGVGDDSWDPVPLEAYRAHLEHVRSLVDAGSLWMSPPSAVVRYRQARKECGSPRVSGNHMSFPSSNACSGLHTDLTVILSMTGAPSALFSRCGSRENPGRRRPNGEWLLDVDPTTSCEIVSGDSPSGAITRRP